jgi:hypothetical protein
MLRKHPIQGMETGIPPSYPSPSLEEGLADQKATRSCQTSPIVIVVEVQVMDDCRAQPTHPCGENWNRARRFERASRFRPTETAGNVSRVHE